MLVILAAAMAATVVAVIAMPLLIRFLRRRGLGQPIHDALTFHAAKSGTPTMGGTVVILALIAGMLAASAVSGRWPSPRGLLVAGVVIGASLVGGVDDWLKIRRERNLGLREWEKTVGVLLAGAIFAFVELDSGRACHALTLTHCTGSGIPIARWIWPVAVIAIVWLTSNAYNFTDGMDGLAAGCGFATFGAFALIAFWAFRHPETYRVDGALDLCVIAVSMATGCAWLLWWNAEPARIIMGDVGALGIGTAFAVLAVTLNVPLLLPVIGALYVVEGASSALQRYTYKLYFKKRGGTRRLFRMAPIHFHFALGGWPESTVVVRLWIVNAIAASAGIAIFYADALRFV